MAQMSNDFAVGEKVAWFGPYAREPDGVAVVEKIYKSGHIVVSGRRFRPNGNSAIETGDGYTKASIYKITEEMEARLKRSRKRKAMKKVADWLLAASADDVPDEALYVLHRCASAKKE